MCVLLENGRPGTFYQAKRLRFDDNNAKPLFVECPIGTESMAITYDYIADEEQVIADVS